MKFKKDKLWVYILTALVPIIIFIIIVSVWMVDSLEYKEYKLNFADSITYAQDHDSFRAELNGESTKISYHNALAIYRAIVGGGFGQLELKVPEDPPIVFDFGNGDIMNIWAKDKTTYLVQYIPAHESKICYSTLGVSRYVCLERLISKEWGNSEWQETE
ncbi:MAG: hypothetical protein JXN65_10150 [Clostridia bacterium]|nr:hypothetical protein [Clostridia bacterium]